MVLLHADRDNRLDWRWVLARLATTAYTPPTSQLRWLLLRLPLLFANPACVPQPWLTEQYRLAQLPGFLDTTLAALRAQAELKGQKQVLMNDLPRLSVPTLVLWGDRDLVVPVSQARAAARLLPCGSLKVIANTGHLPHVEHPEKFVAALSGFFTASRGRPRRFERQTASRKPSPHRPMQRLVDHAGNIFPLCNSDRAGDLIRIR